MARDVYTVSVRGAARSARSLSRASRSIQDDLVAELQRIARDARDVFWSRAPKDTSEFADSVEARFSYKTARPRFTIEVDGDRDGFDILPVTRFGHRRGVIRPDSTRTTSRGSRPALSIHVGGRASEPIFRASALGYRPLGDWVEDAADEVERDIDRATARLGRRIESRII